MSKIWNILGVVAMVLGSLAPALTAKAATPTLPPITIAPHTTQVIAMAMQGNTRTVAYAVAAAISEAQTAKTSYTFSAEHGDGITHLARKAVAQYLHDQNEDSKYTRAQRVYLEDFLQNQIGTFGLHLGQAETFAVADITAALNAVSTISENTLSRNIAKFVKNVDWERYESLNFAGSSEQQVAQNSPGSSDTPSVTNPDQNPDKGQIDSSKTENTENTSRRRVAIYIILIIIVLGIAGYFLLKEDQVGSTSDSGPLKKIRKFSAESFLKREGDKKDANTVHNATPDKNEPKK